MQRLAGCFGVHGEWQRPRLGERHSVRASCGRRGTIHVRSIDARDGTAIHASVFCVPNSEEAGIWMEEGRGRLGERGGSGAVRWLMDYCRAWVYCGSVRAVCACIS